MNDHGRARGGAGPAKRDTGLHERIVLIPGGW